jgi:hypothetical protein
MPADPDIPLNRPYVPGMRGFGPTFGQPQPRHGGGSQNIPPRMPPPFPGQVVTVPRKGPGTYGGAYANVFKPKVAAQRQKELKAAAAALARRAAAASKRLAKLIRAAGQAGRDPALGEVAMLIAEKYQPRAERAIDANKVRELLKTQTINPLLIDPMATVDAPSIYKPSYDAPLSALPKPQVDAPTYRPPLVGPGAYNESVYGPGTDSAPGTGRATAPRTGAAFDPRPPRGVWQAPATAPATGQTPGINPGVGPGPQTVIDKFIEQLGRQLDRVVDQVVAARPGPRPPRTDTPFRPFVDTPLTPIKDPGVGSAPEVFPGQSTSLYATPATRPDAKPDTQTSQCECGPPKKKGECAQGYFTQSPNGDVQYKIWSRRKCQ